MCGWPPAGKGFRRECASVATCGHVSGLLARRWAAGRDATRAALAALLASAQSAGRLGPGEADEMAWQYLGLLWEGLMVGLLLGVAATPEPAEAERRASKATAAFMRLHPDPTADG